MNAAEVSKIKSHDELKSVFGKLTQEQWDKLDVWTGQLSE